MHVTLPRAPRIASAALALAASFLLFGCNHPHPEGMLQEYVHALAEGDGRGACKFLAAEASEFETKCTAHLAYMRVNAPWLAGAEVHLETVSLEEGNTRVYTTVTTPLKPGNGSVYFKLSCDAGRDKYPMASCTDNHPKGAYWVLSVSRQRQ